MYVLYCTVVHAYIYNINKPVCVTECTGEADVEDTARKKKSRKMGHVARMDMDRWAD